jgi:hypothetical protein
MARIRNCEGMTRLWQRSSSILPSENGFLAFAGREGALTPREATLKFRDLVSADMDWAASRKRRFRWRAAAVQVCSLLLTAVSTVILGIQAIPARAAWALPFVALVTVAAGCEAFFNWKSRWILMEETQYRLNRLRDEIDYYLVTTDSPDATWARLDVFFQDQQTIWSEVSRRWVGFRRVHPDAPARGAAQSTS